MITYVTEYTFYIFLRMKQNRIVRAFLQKRINHRSKFFVWIKMTIKS